MITPDQIRAARGLLDISQRELANELGMQANTLSNIEKGHTNPPASRLQAIQTHCENAGVAFIDGGVQWRRSEVKRYKGTDGLIALMNDVYEVARDSGGRICLYNAKPENWLDYLSIDWFKMHAERMMAIADNFEMRILAEEGNTKLISSFYAIHRWFPKKLFISENESLYIYGDKLGFLTFGKKDVDILVFQSKQFSKGVRTLFNIAWDHVGIMPECGEKLEKVDFSEWHDN